MSDGVSEYWKQKQLDKKLRIQREELEDEVLTSAFFSILKITGQYYLIDGFMKTMEERWASRQDPWPG